MLKGNFPNAQSICTLLALMSALCTFIIFISNACVKYILLYNTICRLKENKTPHVYVFIWWGSSCPYKQKEFWWNTSLFSSDEYLHCFPQSHNHIYELLNIQPKKEAGTHFNLYWVTFILFQKSPMRFGTGCHVNSYWCLHPRGCLMIND